MTKKRNKKLPKKRLLLSALLILLFVLGAALYLTTRPKPKISPTPTATIRQLPAQPAPNNGEKQLTSSTGVNKGGATDNQGQSTSPSTSAGQWLISQSGAITVKHPISNSTIKSGAEVSGSATVSKVQYRLIDNQVGVISEGFINVVNGNFSANINFQAHSTGGRLDVFSTDPNGGPEMNEVQVPVSF